MNETQNAIDIAVIKTELNGLREQQKAHAVATKEQFDKLDAKVDELLAVMNRGKGAYTASLLVAGALGAAILKIMGAAFSYLQGK